MRELPRQLTVDQLEELFEGRTALVERLAEIEDPLDDADEVVRTLTEDEKLAALDAHPAIGQRDGLSARSAAEQGSDDDPAVLAELAELNRRYEEQFGFRFVVFVNRRPKAEIVPDPSRAPGAHPRRGARHRAVRARGHRPRPLAARMIVAVDPYLIDWLDLTLRWLHVIAGVVWIGTSFYFVALDNHLAPPKRKEDADEGVAGESWEIHGGGFYLVQKFRVAPRTLPEPLHWFKWEAYTTWLSGFALFCVLYYVDADLNLVGADMSEWTAIAVSLALLAVAWLVYDGLCRVIRNELVLAAILVALTTVAAYGLSLLFTDRAVWLQLGAMLGTIMVANVFFVIIPAHWDLVRAKQAGREPDPAPGIRAKQRSVHNNYLTLPVLLAMLGDHFAFAYGHADGWLVLVCLMLVGAWIRLFFNLRHAGRTVWWIPVTRRGRAGRDRRVDQAARRRRLHERASRRLRRGGADRRAALRVLSLGRGRAARASASRRPSRSRRRRKRSSGSPCSPA